MTKGQLIKWSMARDALDLVGIGQVPPLNWLLDLPILGMHFMYAGPKALITLPELIPIVGILPIFTLAAFSYPNRDEPPDSAVASNPDPVVVSRIERPALAAPVIAGEARTLYAVVDGKLVPVIVRGDQSGRT